VKDDQGIVLCYKCGNEKLRQEHEEYRARLKESGGRFRKGTEFIVPGIVGIIIAVAGGALLYFFGDTNDAIFGENVFIGFIAYCLFEYTLFSIPFCYIMLSDLFAPKYDTINDKFDKWYFKVVISLFGGWIVFTFLWVRFLIRKIMSKKHNA